ncbi:MFS transporter [Roseibium marinum]|uniref:Putative MFS family arabinose efflux permease n=1 Tax=Roseibium marinum TaxID=281252 RepID=A0A2S3UND8_9HYPH|nr:MFS transporter [Roseibium marinum]POF29206.1 putative MFS family arabinose efflux permease [Roseibium marinum]
MSRANSLTERPLWLDAAAIGLLMTATLKIMANATISPALPALEASFSDDPGAAYLTRFLVSAPSLSVVLVAPFAGMVADRIGRARLLLAGVLLFVVSGSAGAYLPDLFSILASRLLLGVAVAMVMTAQVALVGDMFTGAQRSAFMGWQTAAINFSGFLYIGFAGYLAGLSPRLPFFVYALPVVLLPFLVLILRNEKRPAASAGRPSELPGGTAVGRWFLPAALTGLLTMVTVMLFFLMPSQLPFYLDRNGFDAASATAIGLGALTLTGGVVAFTFRRISERLGLAVTFGLGFLLMGCGFAALSGAALWALILAGAALVGAGYALVQPGFLMLALQVAPPARRGSVAGVVTTAMFLGQVISPLALTPVIQGFGFAAVYLGAAAALCMLAVASVVFALFRHRGRTDRNNDTRQALPADL